MDSPDDLMCIKWPDKFLISFKFLKQNSESNDACGILQSKQSLFMFLFECPIVTKSSNSN